MTTLFQKKFLTVFGLILFILAYAALPRAFAENGWHEIESRDGIEIFSRKVKGSPLLAFKGVATINASIGTIISTINDKARHKEWVSRLAESKTLHFFSPLESIEYTHVYGIWPISDRDVVFHSKATIDEEKGEVVIVMHSVTHPAMPERDGIVRAELMNSKYVLTVRGEKKTHIEAEFHGDPRGWVPIWIANYFQKSWPFVTLKNMKEQAERLEKEGLYPTYDSLLGYYLPLAEKYEDPVKEQKK